MKKKISDILLLSDMDGTLIHSPQFPIKRDTDAINRFVDAGGHFALATGRSKTGVDHYKEGIKINSPVALLNGIVVYNYDKDKIISDNTLPLTAALYIKEIKEKFPGVGIEVNINNDNYAITYDHFLSNREKIECYSYIHSTIDELPQNWYKVLFTPGDELMASMEEFVASKNWSDVECVATNKFFFEMLPLGATKGTALKEIALSLGIDMENTAAIGDYYNDMPMLEVAGISAAPSDALPEVHDMVDYVVGDSRQGAVADFIDILFDLCDYH